MVLGKVPILLEPSFKKSKQIFSSHKIVPILIIQTSNVINTKKIGFLNQFFINVHSMGRVPSMPNSQLDLGEKFRDHLGMSNKSHQNKIISV